MAGDVEAFINAIIGQESGGDYNAVGAQTRYGRAYGRYQVLETNIAAWGREAGYPNLTKEKFLASPAIQDAVARKKLTSYFNAYGAAGAASAWYSGSPKNANSTKKQGGGPSVKGYVDSVLARMGDPAPASGTFGAEQPVDRNAAIASYGYVAQLANDVPELKGLLNQALATGWTAERFTAEVQRTNWWRTTAESKRQAQVLKAQDPAEYAKQLRQKRTTLTQLAVQMGASLTRQELDHLSEQALLQGWDSGQLQRYVAAEVNVAGGAAKGQAAVTVGQLKQMAADYYVPLGDGTLQKWTQQILAGDVPAEAFQSYLVEQAKSRFPQMAASLDKGVTAKQWFQPYQDAAASVLELPPEAVDFSQSRYRDAVFAKDPNTGASSALNLSQYKSWLRRQPAYGKTAQARESAATFGNRLLEEFGKVSL